MDVQKLQELAAIIEESLLALRHMTIALKIRKPMLPTLASQIDENEVKLGRAGDALLQLKRELGIHHDNEQLDL